MSEDGATEELRTWLGRKLSEHAMTQTALAKRVGVSQTQISSYLRCRRRPSPETCRKLADALAVPVDEVLIVAGHRPPLVTDGDMELNELVALIQKVVPSDRNSVKDFMLWQIDRSERSWRYSRQDS